MSLGQILAAVAAGLGVLVLLGIGGATVLLAVGLVCAALAAVVA